VQTCRSLCTCAVASSARAASGSAKRCARADDATVRVFEVLEVFVVRCFCPVIGLAGVDGEGLFPQPDCQGRDLDEFVAVDEFERLLEGQFAERDQADGII